MYDYDSLYDLVNDYTVYANSESRNGSKPVSFFKFALGQF